MPKRHPAATERVSIMVGEAVVLKTTIDPLRKKHLEVYANIAPKKKMVNSQFLTTRPAKHRVNNLNPTYLICRNGRWTRTKLSH